MNSRFGKFENGVIKHWSQTIYLEFFFLTKHEFGLFDFFFKISSQFFDLDMENPVGRAPLAKLELSL
jgi:hypothetical protein